MAFGNTATEYYGAEGVGQVHAVSRSPGSDDRSQTEVERLKCQATRLQHVLQVMPSGVVIIDGKGIVRQANPMARQLLGEPLEGMRWREVIPRSFQPQKDDGHEVSLANGRKVKLSITPLVDEPGQLIVLTDLTETRELQQRISHMQRLSALGKTVASMVHQIRTPLSAAILYAANLAGKGLASDARSTFVGKLQARLGELESQVNDMLLFAKSGEQQVLHEVALQPLLDDVRNGCEAMLLQLEGELVTQTLPPHLAIQGNQPALKGALQNLVHNALQECGKGARIRIDAQVTDSGDTVCIRVSDNGQGIPADHIEHIFEPFYTTKSQGTGLGLAVVAAVAKSHGGFIRADNLAQGGACFSLFIPLCPRQGAVDPSVSVEEDS
ncbi:PAS domain-containing protein [Aestuariibacter halophilus]|uniref:histidine kinase n=1 Tax=Fluctibacter halophilus TaxID=226011 RepID=A0ABS8G3H1_9ALTE|nr:ATP-binding protein [Aestuariibacter halophilus]MCC2615142.1 PAS domain-containing protein [Aestuariibacter halophilus]